MANPLLFATRPGSAAPVTDARNAAGGAAYQRPARQALAQYAVTGCLNTTYYATAAEQLNAVLALARQVEPEFLAQTAVYAREQGFMKDLPALLCAVLATRDPARLERVFPRVMDDGRMVRNFVQILRSGAVGRKSLGTAPKRMVQNWLAARPDEAVFRAAIGNAPSLADVIRMVHPRPANETRAALYAYLLGRPHAVASLPPVVREFEAFKAGARATVPAVPFQLLTALALGTREWTEIAKAASWQTTRMNLNTFARHGVFADDSVVKLIAERLANPDQVRRARVFPYQLLAAYEAAESGVPERVRAALLQAMEHATANVPQFAGRVIVAVDVSGSMQSPVTGQRPGGTTVVRCVEVAALIAATVLRRNRQARVLPFHTRVEPFELAAGQTIMANARQLAGCPSGGTDCAAPLAHLNAESARGDLVILVSDNESWASPPLGRGTEMLRQWDRFRGRNRGARLVCLDLQPNATVQAPDREDILNVGGFADQVFQVIAEFAAGRLQTGHWEQQIAALAV